MDANIRNYKSEDANDIRGLNFLFYLSYQFNKDFKKENIFCAEIDNQIIAAGHLEPTDSCEYLNREGKDSNYIHRFAIDTDSNGHDHIEVDIFDRLVERAYQISQSYPNKRIQISQTCDHDDFKSINFLLSNGFYHSLSYFIMKRDLTKPLPEYKLNKEIEIKRWAWKQSKRDNCICRLRKMVLMENRGAGLDWNGLWQDQNGIRLQHFMMVNPSVVA